MYVHRSIYTTTDLKVICSNYSFTMTTDPESLLDTIDSFHPRSSNHNSGANGGRANVNVNINDDSKTTAPSKTSNSNPHASNRNGNGNDNGNDNGSLSTTTGEPAFDPIDFLNHHYQTESSLITALPQLRSSLTSRIVKLDDSISTTIQTQADLADLTLHDVSQAKTSILQLQQKIQTVQTKAQKSEKAVQEITKEMKRLDFAKKHLSKTITALKRLHMLLHAVSQLRVCVRVCNPPDYKNAANLVDATFLLLGHFEGYMNSVDKMRMLKYDVQDMRNELNDGIIFGFRVVAFGSQLALQKSSIKVRDRILQNEQNRTESSHDDHELQSTSTIITPLSPTILSHACYVIDALGLKCRNNFIKIFAKDHLDKYNQLFHPRNNTSSGGVHPTTPKPTLKIARPSTTTSPSDNNPSSSSIKMDLIDEQLKGNTTTSIMDNPSSSNPNPASFDQIERRYAWYRRMLREIDETFPNVFPKYWDMFYHLTHLYLKETCCHILLLFSPTTIINSSTTKRSTSPPANNSGTNTVSSGGVSSSRDHPDKHLRDRDVGNVTVLLKALQKTMLFEKEMSAWLQREYNTQFIDEDNKSSKTNTKSGDSEALEFDDAGKAVAATSAEGIRIKYERQMRDRNKKEEKAARIAAGLNEDVVNDDYDPSKDRVQKRVPPLIGVASAAFDKHMKPYILLEEQNMDEQLKESASDKTVDTRGELPVYTSSTALFLYIKNSITRCTVLTKGKTLFLLYRTFQSTLRKYAKILAGKYPLTLSGATAAIIGGLTGGANTVYRIAPGEEKTVCYVIDTCEYCSETVEALQDLIADKIEQKYKSKIDMSGEQEAFQDVTAKGIRVLVSGLIHRTEPAFKSLSGINWSSIDVVGEESKYVRSMHSAIQPFVVSVKGLLPNSYFRSFCDQFATTFTNSFYAAITKCKRISESGTQQLLLDVYNLKTLLLRIPVLEPPEKNQTSIGSSSAASIAPAMYTKMVTKQFARIETMLKLIGTPPELLIDVFKVQWNSGSAFDLQTIMNLKGMKRNEQAAMLEKFGVDPATAYKGAVAGAATGMMTENIQALQDRSSDVAAKVNSDLIQMKQKVDDFRKAFR